MFIPDKTTEELLKNYSSDMQHVIAKIIGASAQTVKKDYKGEEMSGHVSAISKKLNILKNIQNKIYIKQSISSEAIQQKKDKM